MLKSTNWIAAAWMLLAAQTAWGQFPGGELAELRSRMDRLEQENQELRSALVERLPVQRLPQPGSTVDPGRPGYISTSPDYGPSAEDSRVPSAVEQYLDERTPHVVSAERAAPGDAGLAEDGFMEVGQDLSMTARWNNGLELATKDKAFRVHVGGRWQLDTSWFNAEQEVQNNLPGDVRYHDARRLSPGPTSHRRDDVRSDRIRDGVRLRQWFPRAKRGGVQRCPRHGPDRPMAPGFAHADRQHPRWQPKGASRL